MLNGCTSRLLVVRRWDDQIEQTIEQFINKAEQGLDQSLRFKEHALKIAESLIWSPAVAG